MTSAKQRGSDWIQWALLGLWTGVLVILSFIRDSFGIELTDEAFYIAEVLSVEKGNTLYSLDQSLVSGMTLIPLLLLKIFRWFSPQLSGVFLHMRTCFQVFRFVILLGVFYLLKKKYPPKLLVFCLSLMIPFWGSRLPNFSYNTIAQYLFFLAAAIRFSDHSDEKGIRSLVRPLFCGIVVAFGEFAHPGHILNVIWFGLSYLFFRTEQPWKKLMFYLLGGLLVLLSVLGCIIAQSGMEGLLAGFRTFSNTGSERVSILENILAYMYAYRAVGFFLTISWVFAAIICILRKKQGKDHGNILIMGILFGFAISCGYILLRIEPASWMMLLGAAISVGAFYCLITSLIEKKQVRETWILFSFPFFLFLVNGFFTNGGAVPRALDFNICIFGVAFYLLSSWNPGKTRQRIVCSVLVLVMALIGLGSDFLFIYRDAPIQDLKEPVRSGIYQGLYTTKDEAEQIIRLEAYLEEKTSQEQEILFLDQAAFGYLMADCRVCAPSTWDRTNYHTGGNDPSLLYSYFEKRKTEPDLIIYIDYGRDAVISIEAEDHLFNQFVRDKYLLKGNEAFGDLYQVQIYEKKEGNR